MGTGGIIIVFTFFVMSILCTYHTGRALQRMLTEQQRQIDDLKRELEEMKGKES